jgi:hypothetical protein
MCLDSITPICVLSKMQKGEDEELQLSTRFSLDTFNHAEIGKAYSGSHSRSTTEGRAADITFQ